MDRNDMLRKRFVRYLEDNFNPSLRALHKVIGVGYSDLCSWKTGRINYSEKNLKKIEDFLDKNSK
jgi:hypothetical protein